MIEPMLVDSIEGLVAQVKNDYAEWHTTIFPWFRGEPANTRTPLLPKLYRRKKGGGKHNENRLLQWFRMKAPSLGVSDVPPRGHTDEWLFLAQHVGLPTRLLDWTEGLFVALYFALIEKKPKIWMLNPIALNGRSTAIVVRKRFPKSRMADPNIFPLTWFSLDQSLPNRTDLLQIAGLLSDQHSRMTAKRLPTPEARQLPSNLGNINIRAAWENDRFGTELPMAIHPTNVHSRMSAQKSCFTIQGINKKPLNVILDETILRAYEIDVRCVAQIRRDMRMMGITRTTVFPELDSLARELGEVF